MTRILLLAFEFSAIFIGIPLLIYYRVIPNVAIPYLLLGALAAFLYLRHDPAFDSSLIIQWSKIRPLFLPLLLRDAVLLLLLGLAVRFFAPDLLFSFFKRAPAFWALVMLLYPLLSVYPQELLYRAFVFHRYQPLFGNGWAMLLASALAFGLFTSSSGTGWPSVCAFWGAFCSPLPTNSLARSSSPALTMPSLGTSSLPSGSESSSITAPVSDPCPPFHSPPRKPPYPLK